MGRYGSAAAGTRAFYIPPVIPGDAPALRSGSPPTPEQPDFAHSKFKRSANQQVRKPDCSAFLSKCLLGKKTAPLSRPRIPEGITH